MSKFAGAYPEDWPEIAERIKEKAGHRCERCDHDSTPPYVLTVHHLDNDKGNCQDWNLAALCQRCHLSIQGKVDMFQEWMFRHSSWMQAHVKGRDKAIAEGRWPVGRGDDG